MYAKQPTPCSWLSHNSKLMNTTSQLSQRCQILSCRSWILQSWNIAFENWKQKGNRARIPLSHYTVIGRLHNATGPRASWLSLRPGVLCFAEYPVKGIDHAALVGQVLCACWQHRYSLSLLMWGLPKIMCFSSGQVLCACRQQHYGLSLLMQGLPKLKKSEMERLLAF